MLDHHLFQYISLPLIKHSLVDLQRLGFRNSQLGKPSLHIRLEAIGQTSQTDVQISSGVQTSSQVGPNIHLACKKYVEW